MQHAGIIINSQSGCTDSINYLVKLRSKESQDAVHKFSFLVFGDDKEPLTRCFRMRINNTQVYNDLNCKSVKFGLGEFIRSEKYVKRCYVDCLSLS